MSWMTTKNDPNRSEFVNQKNQYQPFRFWLKVGETREVGFLDDERVGVWEHVLKTGEKSFENFTCSQDENCALCGMKNRRTFVEYSTIVETYKTKDGETKIGRKLIGVKGDSIKILERKRKEAGGSLAGKKIRITRDGQKSPNTGNDFTIVGDVNMKAVPQEVAKPYDYIEVLAPPKAGYVQSLLKFGGYASSAEKPISRDSFNQTPPTESFDQSPPPVTEDTDEVPF